MASDFTYAISTDFPGGAVNTDKLNTEIGDSSIVPVVLRIDTVGDSITIFFSTDLSSGEETTLDGDTTNPAGGLIAAHDNTANTELDDANTTGIVFEAEFDNGNSGTADTIDFNNGQKQRSTLTGDVTFTFTAPTSGVGNFLLKLIQDGTGTRIVTWPGTVLWPNGTDPTLSTAASSVDIVSFYWDGTNYFGVSNFDFS